MSEWYQIQIAGNEDVSNKDGGAYVVPPTTTDGGSNSIAPPIIIVIDYLMRDENSIDIDDENGSPISEEGLQLA